MALYIKENNIPNKDKPILWFIFLNIVLIVIGIISQPISIDITNKILKDPKTRLSRIVCIKTIKLVLANPIFFENNIIRNIVNWMLGINDKICS